MGPILGDGERGVQIRKSLHCRHRPIVKSHPRYSRQYVLLPVSLLFRQEYINGYAGVWHFTYLDRYTPRACDKAKEQSLLLLRKPMYNTPEIGNAWRLPAINGHQERGGVHMHFQLIIYIYAQLTGERSGRYKRICLCYALGVVSNSHMPCESTFIDGVALQFVKVQGATATYQRLQLFSTEHPEGRATAHGVEALHNQTRNRGQQGERSIQF